MLSGNRNFEGRVNPDVRANYLASPPLVVAYALAGSMQIDLATEPLGERQGRQAGLPAATSGRPTRRSPTLQRKHVTSKMFATRYADVFKGDKNWQGIKVAGGQTYAWDMGSTYVQNPPYFQDMTMEPDAGRPTSSRPASWACSATRSPPTTSRPAGSIKATSPGRPVPASSTRCRRRTSTPTAPAAATTRS